MRRARALLASGARTVAEVQPEPRVYRPQGRQHQRVFRWGVGNKARSSPELAARSRVLLHYRAMSS